ncbi:MAG: hypothetical protein ABIJ56_05450 [Pseudomonadota bacterium]
MQALFSLTPSESKRLIGMAVAGMPEVLMAMRKGYLLVGRGSTNAFVLEALLKKPVEKEKYVAGQVIRGVLCALHQDMRSKPVTFHEGKVLNEDPAALVGKLGPGDVLLKGANAVDHTGKVGVLMASPVGGTMGQFYMSVKAQGAAFICPVGLEKLIPSVEEAARCGGRMMLEKTLGAGAGLACVADARVVTEIEAIALLFSVKAVHFASGGYGGAEGCVTLVIEGEDGKVGKCMDFIENIKGEPPLAAVKGPCRTCPVLCSFKGKDEADLPAYLLG